MIVVGILALLACFAAGWFLGWATRGDRSLSPWPWRDR